jgi:sugar O-acyltransferase (sialic acid O-acetyltransferase NeuD family)
MMQASSKGAFVMFGQSPRFGDYLDIVLACGGHLRKVVVNVADPARAGARTFEDRLRDANQFLRQQGRQEQISVEHLDSFRPQAGEGYTIGFRGIHVRALRDTLRAKFAIAFDPLIHPSAIVSPFGRRDEGIIVGAGVIVASGVALGEFCLLNRGCNIGHDAAVGAYTNIGSGANVASGVVVGEGAVIGIGATIIENIKIGENAFVAAGAVVIRDVAAGALVAGNPAVFKKNWKRSG